MQQNDPNTPKDTLSESIDSAEDREKMQPEYTEIDLPGVEDIPGQENVRPAPLGEMADTTISSADEEGEGLFDDDEEDDDEDIFEEEDEEEKAFDPETDVSEDEKRVLETSASDMPGDDENLRAAALDDTDEDGTPLNVESFNDNITGEDLDVPGASSDDENEAIGAEDEKNNSYSIGGDDNEDAPQDNF